MEVGSDESLDLTVTPENRKTPTTTQKTSQISRSLPKCVKTPGAGTSKNVPYQNSSSAPQLSKNKEDVTKSHRSRKKSLNIVQRKSGDEFSSEKEEFSSERDMSDGLFPSDDESNSPKRPKKKPMRRQPLVMTRKYQGCKEN